MGLNGRLEDLPLLDIVQIVAFSQKTGYLSVAAPAGEAAIVFERGSVVACFMPESPALDPATAALPWERRTPVVRRRIERNLERLIRLREGSFVFSLTTEVPKQIGSRSIREETLGQGIKAEEILLELARGMDEDRRDAAAAVESGVSEVAEAMQAAQPPVAGVELPDEPAVELPEPPASELEPLPELERAAQDEGGHRVVLLVDDEADLRGLLARAFIEGDFQVVEAGSPAVAVRSARSLQDLGLPFVLVVDRGMPTSDGSSFDGGLEVVRRLKRVGFEPPILMMTDKITPTFQERARRMGIARFVFKPTLSRLDPEQFEADIRAFGVRIRQRILPGLDAVAGAAPASTAFVSSPLPRTEEAWRQAAELQRRLEELRQPRDATEISMLVMNMARDFFERAAFFLVKDEELRGLAGFGPAQGEDIILVLRELVIPLAQPSAFQEVAVSGRPSVGPLPAGHWESRLTAALGRYAAREAALLPLVANRQTIALLYGDNPDTGAAISGLETCEVFLAQAGIALENAFLSRKAETRQGQLESAGRGRRVGYQGASRLREG